MHTSRVKKRREEKERKKNLGIWLEESKKRSTKTLGVEVDPCSRRKYTFFARAPWRASGWEAVGDCAAVALSSRCPAPRRAQASLRRTRREKVRRALQ